eukprot:Tbor_TRINITY_DN5765_c2_g1::TRINITY_DN5765_c2_g1_i2::g.20148::m.20148/K03667/hslU; ATP-dependent HslUV protease ATP-binding subunit HslU
MFRRVSSRLCQNAEALASAGIASTHLSREQLDSLSPKAVVEILDRFIVGQRDAKKAVAVSLRNRWRRRHIPNTELQAEITPKNILMIGPTGVGKTEIARRMAKITDCPFVKVEATKYTEVGFKGKDVESMIEDLYANAKTKARRKLIRERSDEAQEAAEDAIFTAFMKEKQITPSSEADTGATEGESAEDDIEEDESDKRKRSNDVMSIEEFRAKLATGELDDEMVTIDIVLNAPENKSQGMQSGQLGDILFGDGNIFGPRKITQRSRKSIKDAIPIAKMEAYDKLIDTTQVESIAKQLCEEEGLIFLDEIDKVVSTGSFSDDPSALGVQQDLLPLIEGCVVTLKDGTAIKTDCILFICSGAFHSVKPSDMIAEFQGRLPVRVELQALKEGEFRQILTEPKYNLLKQQIAMLKCEGLDLSFSDEGVNAIAKVTAQVNGQGQNIGARRLHTIIELVMEEYSFETEKYTGKPVVIDEEYVLKRTGEVVKNVDLSKYLI